MRIRGKHLLVTALTGAMALALWGSSHQAAFAAYIPFTGLKGDVSVGADGLTVTVSKFGGTLFKSMAGQAASAIAVTGGAMDGVTVGANTPAAITATTVVGTSLSAGAGPVGGGAGNFSGPLTSAGQVAGFRQLLTGASTTFGTTDQVVCINKTTGSATAVTGPASPVIGQVYTLIDCKGDASTNNITFSPSSGTVNGASSFTIAGPFNAINIVYSSATTANIF